MDAKAASLLEIEAAGIFSAGRRRTRGKARSLVCYWGVRELGLSLADLTRVFGLNIPGISYAVAQKEALVRAQDYRLEM
ncbi:MAG: hypothetical protein GW861_03940 [Deltaproteobacteria bacterium]|nr:hypothetical protein [Deltaproteobacteria bacterium]